MRVWVRVVVLATLLVGVALLFGWRRTGANGAGERPARASADVRVEHELVPATVIEEPARTSVAARQPEARRAVARGTQKGGIVSRARRLFLGDGRHRPEPFPRAGQ